MKKLCQKLLFSLAIVGALVACKSDDESENPEDLRAENLKGLGSSAEDLLSSDVYKSMTVELAYAGAERPDQEAIDGLMTFIRERVNKPGGVNLVETVIPVQEGQPFTSTEIREIESNVRTRFTEGDNIAVWVYSSAGSSTNDTETTVTLGTAYQNTSLVMYNRTLKDLTGTSSENLRLLQGVTLNHEFGHIFGLVNILNDDIHSTGHEDTAHPKHGLDETCLMYFEASNLNRAQLTRMMDGGQVPVLDPLCIEDLQAKGGK